LDVVSYEPDILYRRTTAKDNEERSHGRPCGHLPTPEKNVNSLQLQRFGSHKQNQHRCHQTRFTSSKFT